jgi:hypothetical protein
MLKDINKDLFYLFDFLIRDFIGIKELSNIKAFLNIFGTESSNGFNSNQIFIFG